VIKITKKEAAMFYGKYMQRIACFTMIVFMGMVLTADGSFAKAGTAQAEFSSPRVKEKVGSTPEMGKKKKFPIFIVVLGIGVVAGLLLVLGKKKDEQKPPEPETATYVNGILTIKGIRYELAAIPAGTFAMGSTAQEALAEERPVHDVRISQGFWLGKTEVTQGVWQAVMGSNPAQFKGGDNYPLESVSWEDCRQFIAKLNQMTGKNSFRLPTEAEWEYACRAGTTAERYSDLDAVAWYSGNSGNSNHPVAQKLPNAWGLYDMLGNIYEWCSDWYAADYYAQSPSADPQGPTAGTMKVSRGGCSFFDAAHTRAAHRQSAETVHKNYGMGLRLAAISAGN
jgi:formylglycine-generating enzyme required for sulfatase activity